MIGDVWVEVSIAVTPDTVESVAEVIFRYTEGGVSIDHAVEGPIAEAWATDIPVGQAARPLIVRGYMPDTASAASRRAALERAVWHLRQIGPMGDLVVREVQAADWENAWRDHFQVHRVGKRFVIRPTWRSFTLGEDDAVIILDPGMAFGTGLHPTTQLCLRALERLIRPGYRVADVGTGSGILAIGAGLLGAHEVDALDIDEVAVTTAAQNVTRNGLEAVVRCRQDGPGSLPRSRYDIVVANIIARVIEEHASDLVGSAVMGGTVICSGILYERHDAVVQRLMAANLSRPNVEVEGDWCVLTGVRR